MEPKHKAGTSPKKIAQSRSQLTTKSTANSGGRSTGTTTRKAGTFTTPPIAPPRLKSRSGGKPVKSPTAHQRMKK